MGFPIRKSPDHRIFAPPRSLSQLITSFIGSWCQGIPLALFIAWPIRDMVLYSWIMQAITDYAKLLLLPSSFNRSVPQLKIHNFSFKFPWKTSLLPCFFITCYVVQFSRCSFQLLLKPDLKIQFLGFWDPTPNWNLGGPEWARTTDLTIISRTL